MMAKIKNNQIMKELFASLNYKKIKQLIKEMILGFSLKSKMSPIIIITFPKRIIKDHGTLLFSLINNNTIL